MSEESEYFETLFKNSSAQTLEPTVEAPIVNVVSPSRDDMRSEAVLFADAIKGYFTEEHLLKRIAAYMSRYPAFPLEDASHIAKHFFKKRAKAALKEVGWGK